MAELLHCPFCGGEAEIKIWKRAKIIDCSAFSTNPDYCKTKKLPSKYLVKCSNKKCIACRPQTRYFSTKKKAIEAWNTRTPKERGADKPKITCLNCKHLMFSDMYGECNKQLRIVNPSDTCEYAEPKERGGEK